ncbi:MAG: imidazole glycerol phosphate synthase subunit HisH [Candidatus Peribacter sp.]|jgi:imidazole glycerol-phosphate synthase subunit HisH|nr:imidazole glycerol phosphate synthase subunit HisH [Candidatus Peribacter sp.]MBT4393175.1 imidazole glycerol phosphate synthase subunit HisH [Candidatus Peribacter sp.]MBT4600481.1 imidazole glycerol phosphate synthase subunit HisH [Candidatus Peribacter sp.]MBT5148543.1 imidazole glycerol phosphate synthase subunit HisH [Candidatus Peribacter sp.]MBT5638710.1 imidazole glycerol phosphate synthase subunit HisH [Candidatus Peribacter sp.]
MVTVIDYGLGNIFSVVKAFEMIGADVQVSSDASDIRSADHLVLPGVGAFADGMQFLHDKDLDTVLTEEVVQNKKPFLGICLGLQLLAEIGQEHGEHKGLGWIPGKVQVLDTGDEPLKIPHVGWNNLEMTQDNPLFTDIHKDSDFYFVHSYQLHCTDPKDCIATTTYGETITAAIWHDNIFATQFHPEKSQDAGLKLLENFLSYSH